MFDRRDVFVVVHGTWIQSSGIEPSAQGTDMEKIFFAESGSAVVEVAL